MSERVGRVWQTVDFGWATAAKVLTRDYYLQLRCRLLHRNFCSQDVLSSPFEEGPAMASNQYNFRRLCRDVIFEQAYVSGLE